MPNNNPELPALMATAVDIATSGDCQVSEVAIELMRRREAGELISKNERHRLIIENALKRT